MDRNGDHMAVDPVSPAATSTNPKEKELFDQQPTAPRRNSIEDQDSSRPRKRLATMGSTTPQSSSPSTDKEDAMEHSSPRSATLTASPATIVTTPTASGSLGDQTMDQAPDSPLQTLSTDDLAAEEIAASAPSTPVKPTINVRSLGPLSAPKDLDHDAVQAARPELTEPPADADKPISVSSSEVTSASQSPWQDGSYLRSPEVEIEELEGMDEDEVLAESVTVVGHDPDQYSVQKEAFHQISRELALSQNPRNEIIKVESFISRFLDGSLSEDEQIAAITSPFSWWSLLPDVITSLLRRRESLSPEFVLGRDQEGRRILNKFFTTILRLTARLTALEGKIIQETPSSVDFTTISTLYQMISTEILAAHDELSTHLLKDFNISLASDIAPGLPDFLEAWDPLYAVKSYLRSIYMHLPEKPKLLGVTSHPLSFLVELLRFSFHRDWLHDLGPERYLSFNTRLCEGILEIVVIAEAATKKTLESQVQSINIKDYGWVVDSLGMCVCMLTSNVREFGLQLLPQHLRGNFISLNLHDRGEYAQALFKLPMLTNMIRSNRMDCRLMGISKLSDCLLRLWKALNGEDHSNSSPALKYMADDIRRSGIIEYLVGPESHPELIRLSYNIGSFLVVNHCMTPDIVQAVWQPLLDNKDPRIVQGVVKMVIEFLIHMSYDSMVDLCTRAIDIPFSSYDTVMLEFVSNLLSMTSRRYMEENRTDDTETHHRLDPAPYLLIIGLIRRASIAEEEGQTCKGVSPSSISDMMAHELVNITQYGPPADVRRKIYLECVADLKEKNASATGSIIVLWALLQRRPRISGDDSPEIDALTGDLGCVDALIDDIAAFVESHRDRDLGLRARKLKARLDLLYWILFRSPDCMSPSQIDQLCLYLIGDKALGHQERDTAFNTFASLIIPNPFIDYLFCEVYPKLNPLHISLHCLEACKRWVEYLNKQKPEITPANVVVVKGVEQIWRLILTVPDRHLALEAIYFLIRIYLESSPVINQNSEIIYATHRSVVERCIQQLTSCATALKVLDGEMDQLMVIDTPESEMGAKHKEFDRSIMVLNELIKGYRAKPRFSSGAHLLNGFSDKHISGTPVNITIRWYSQGLIVSVQHIQMGNLDTVGHLHKEISRIIGSSDYRAILNGRELHLQDNHQKTLSELGFPGIAQLMVQRRATDNEQAAPAVAARETLNIIETEILKHFEELFVMLDSRETQAAMIWNLLSQFPPQPRALGILMSKDIPTEEILPSGSPYRSLYLLNAMRVWIDEHTQGESKSEFITRMVTSLVSFLMQQDAAINSSTELRFKVLDEALTVLFKFLNALPINSEAFEKCFKNEAEFVSRMARIWEPCLQPQHSRLEISGHLASSAFGIVLEAAKFRRGVWTVFTTNQECVQGTKRMLLQDMRPLVRRNVGQTMVNTFNSTRLGDLKGIEVARFFWSVLVEMLPEASSYDEQVSEIFEVAKCTLEYLGQHSEIDGQELNRHFVDWTNVLITHKVKQVIGRPHEDFIIIGYTQLLLTCLNFLRRKTSCPDLQTRVIGIFRNLLFTPLTLADDDDAALMERLPCLGSQAREKLYRLLLQLSEDEQINMIIIRLLSELVGEDQPPLSPESTWNVDRSQLPISTAGRVGLRNLSNTCYLNSLLTQLFMNVEFREFILNMTVDDPEDSQNLLQAIKALFAKMQNGLVKTADTREFAQAIKDYENNEIDVTVQMDVDEFFNLLFDRIEGQMESVEQKNAFRSYYGGKLVQQVKSKECPHISEREEPFSAIQCDIKGKIGLQDSLKAYVEGEIMEGDNKYSCTSCNKHVDAVKRACLKEIPDHLIFHLKRFEFDLHTMVRSKINDTFEFPECIDMRPYTIEYLSDSDPCTTPDVFQLAGVLVHNGTAESGHYYSYIKDRHEFTEQCNPIWFEFNDSEVSSFDPSTIPTSCYGGTDFIGPNKELGQPIAFHKSYSAYMLFYERVKPSPATDSKPSLFKKIPIPRELEMKILRENEETIRKYCLFDGAFIWFTTSILRQSHSLRVTKGTTEAELLEQQALRLALRTYEQIGSRIKDSREAEELFDNIKKLATSPTLECARGFLRWICDHPDSLRLLLLKCLHPRIRESFCNLILGALNQIRRYGDVYDGDVDDLSDQYEFRGFLYDVLRTIMGLWEYLNNIIKSWDEYFSLLIGIASFGPREKEILLQHGLLKKSLVIFMPEYLDRETRHPHQNLVKAYEKTPKRFSYRCLLEFIATLLDATHFGLEPCKDESCREMVQEIEAFPLTISEKYLLWRTIMKERVYVNAFIFKQLASNCHITLTQNIIRKILEMDEEPFVLGELTSHTKTALMHGIALDPANEAGPYLQGLVVYCLYTRSAADVKELIPRVANEVITIHMNGGREHLDFFKQLWYGKNQRLKPPMFVFNRVMETVSQWAPPLLCYWEPQIRIETEQLLNDRLFLMRSELLTEGRRRAVEGAIERLQEGCFRFAEEKFLKNKDLCAAADSQSFDSVIRILHQCPKMDMEEDPVYISRIDGLRNMLARHMEEIDLVSENWAASDVGSDSNHEIGDDDSV